MIQPTRLESYLQDVNHALGRKVSGIERAPYEVLTALRKHRRTQSFARRVWVGWGHREVMGAAPLQQRGKNKGKWSCRAVGERVCQIGLWTCLPGFPLQEANSLPWPGLSPVQPVRFLQLYFCLCQLLKPSLLHSPAGDGASHVENTSYSVLKSFKSLKGLHLHWVARAGASP